MRSLASVCACLLVISSVLIAQQRPDHYALILADPPVASVIADRTDLQSARAVAHADRIVRGQQQVRADLATRHIQVTGAVHNVLNAVFVVAPDARIAELRGLPGVSGVVKLHYYKHQLNAADDLINAPAAWGLLGGTGNAGRGTKIGIIDSGIDITHPAFQDSSLTAPSGYPKCSGADCAFTNSKVIVARSYVATLAAGTDPTNPSCTQAYSPACTKPDDLTPRDRDGHGTAVSMVAAGNTVNGPLATITGVAPKAFLGNYKVFGTPGVNDGASGDSIITAVDDALADGMDTIVLSLGFPSFYSPSDKGQDCGLTGNTPCDAEAAAIENASSKGLTVVAAAGNDGLADGAGGALNTIDSPGIAASAIAVGAITNSHQFVSTLYITGGPGNLQNVDAVFGDGPRPNGPVIAPGIDGRTLGDADGCAPFPKNSLSGSFVLVNPDNCDFSKKVNNAQLAGAVALIMYLTDVEPLFQPGGLRSTTIPCVLISHADSQILLSYIAANASAKISLDPKLRIVNATANQVADFSSRGPSIGNGVIKPELMAVGTQVYMAAETVDAYGELYSPTGFSVADGTSFATPMVAGAVALVKQKNPSFTPAQLKSAVVNTANMSQLTDFTGGTPLRTAVGNGRLDAAAAVSTTVTVQPSTLSFGILRSGFQPIAIPLTITNTSTSAASLSFSLQSTAGNTSAVQLTLDKQSASVGAGTSTVLTVMLKGSLPAAGEYDGVLLIDGGAEQVRVPYMYLVGDGVPADIFPLTGDSFDGNVGAQIPDGILSFKIVDQYGVPVPNVPVTFSVTQGGGKIQQPDAATDANGIAAASAFLGPTVGDQAFRGSGGGLSWDFLGTARPVPTIAAGGALNAATNDAASGVAPGSYISLYAASGSSLSDSTKAANTASLPLALDEVSVSFDAPGISVPGRIYYVSPGQVNVQVPWELQGQSSAQIKVSIQDSLGAVYTLPLKQYSPGIFQYSSGGQLIAAAEHINGSLITPSAPIRAGETIQLFVNGLGPVSNQPATGEPAPTSPLARTSAQPTVTIGGATAQVSFSGLTPGISGLYQLNVVVPAGLSSGLQPVVVSIGGVSSKPANIPAQ